MGKSKAPATPDYQGIALQQGGINKETAMYNAGLSHVNQYSPYGSVNFEHYIGADGNPVSEQRTTMAPDQQRFFQKGIDQKNDLVAGRETGVAALDDYMKQSRTSIDPNVGEDARKAMVDAVYSQYKTKLDPRYDTEQRQQENRLVQQGLTPGSEAYVRQMGDFRRSRDEAYQQANNSSVIQGDASQNQAFQQMLAKYAQVDQNFDKYKDSTAAFLPQYQNVNGSGGAAAADIQGAGQQAYQADLNATNTSNANKSSNTQAGMSALAMYAMYAM